ncbi:glycine/betaine ABC transporter [Staphylococcus ureilyticus]|uniref:Glycine/betaine ABC transporter n=9 Tax=Staphylococcus TaxID=1279 RepID=A0AB34AL30_STAUR|nr:MULTISPECIES: BCCT family transporter [Staphylococcus]AYX90927.1 BCCT family transporter [Staphylococcus cohnii]KKI62749.1 Glycine betaine transporter OpuD [Staphylococcus cohnii subsp. cohnii]QKU19756.1 BCCT family transporter [Staphylococcus cohnii]SUM05895.1 Glycine betaine transporter OpuD [Staphylococcus cohnii]GEQ04066.1 glycine/betaine ABC transporter [Staphylococcus ureilyticus]
MENKQNNANGKKLSSVFTYSIIITAIVVLLGAIFPTQFNEIGTNITGWITEYFGWYYMIIVALMIFFCVFLIFSPIGKLKLGQPEDKPEFNTISWFAMLFSAGMGIGLVFWGAAEPISHFVSPPSGDPQSATAYKEALRGAFMQWGFHAWAVYGVVALALAYFQFRKNEPALISKTLRPIFGNKVDGPLGTIIDVVSVFATIGGVAVSLGLGAMQIAGGLNYLFDIPNNIVTQGIIILIVTILFLISAWSGLSRGIQYLSNANISIAGFILLFVLIVGPTVLILNMLTSSTGVYLNTLLFNMFDTAPLDPQKNEWMKSWTFFQLAWWISWSPFVGIFIARVSKGRSIREFVSGVLLAPVLVSLVWFAAFGVLGIETAKKTPKIFDMPPETALFGVFNEVPLGFVLSIVTLLLIATFFITSADSATFVLGMQTTFGSLNPSVIVKVIWGIAQALIAFILLFSGGDNGLNALQNTAIMTALPFSIIVLCMMVSFYKDANQERKFLGLTLSPNKHRLKEYINSQSEDFESEMIERRKNIKND